MKEEARGGSVEKGKKRKYQLGIYSVLFLGYGLYTYNRRSVSFALPTLIDGRVLDKSGAGLVTSCQNGAYAVSKFLGGVLSDRISSRVLFSSGLFISGVAAMSFSAQTSLTAFTSLWILNGLGQGCGWPASAKVLKKWFSPTQFGTYWSTLSASSNLSGSLCPLLAAYIITTHDWQTSILFAGVVSALFAVVTFLTIIDTPAQINMKEEGLQAPKQETKSVKGGSKMTWKDLVQSPMLWLVSCCYMVVFAAKTSVVDWGQMYLIEDLGRTQFVGSSFTSSVETGGFFGGIAAGYITDWMVQKHQDRVSGNPRMLTAIFFKTGVAICLHLLYFNIHTTTAQTAINVLGFVLGMCLYGPIAIYGIVATESYPSHLSGTAHAVVALAANVGAITSGLPFSYIAREHTWGAIFLLLEVVTILCLLIMVLTRRLHVTKHEKED